ncbi:ATP-grasp domain-containing protein [Actinomadura logoneensis]|uniref:ATP-grasp domain-containing protein n=1 Tax=Actinomadura logoneensis TaxID=2293572 RepID=A0A372J8M7_9ACTN|nr:ATP-grasp domain-containing protein [Actinomadura logoneensis]RFU36352.1 ATP-grasp domain-containing protein [Actinomadura logoneensis]
MRPLTRDGHVTIIHRWRARYAHYERYLDHDRTTVTYITTEVGAAGVPEGAARVELVAATDDLAEVEAAVDRLADRYGKPCAILAMKEDDLLVAARLRADRGLPGQRPDQLMPFRDKLLMVGQVARHGLAVPEFAAANTAADVTDFGKRVGWPVVVKPMLGSSSVDVRIVHGPDEAAAPTFDPTTSKLVQKFIPHPVYHVDGVFDGSDVGVCVASRYVNTCLSFRAGEYLGSVEEDDPEVNAATREFAGRVLRALASEPLVFHLEVFVERPGGGAPVCTFLEVGARVAGSETAFLWREVHGYDLMEAAFRIALGEAPPPAPASFGGDLAGYLLVGAPATRPCRVSEVTPMTGRTPGLYQESLVLPGEVIPAADAYYEHVGGRFRFRGRSSAEIEQAIHATARDFHVTAVPLDETA